MTEMQVDEALRMIARRALHRLLEADKSGVVFTEWEDYPLIGEWDWYRVLELMDEEMPDNPSPEKFDAAYALLAGRADGEA